MRAVEELSLCPGIVEGAQNAAIPEELYRRSLRRQKKRKKKLQVQPCIGALTTEAMDLGKSATESLSTTESIYKVKRNKGTKEHHQNIKV